MKKASYFFFMAFLCAALVASSCKKKGDPGPAGTNGTNGTNGVNGTLPYKETGTSITVTGNYASDNAAFNNLFTLPYYATLSENASVVQAPVLRQGDARTTALGNIFYITRRDSLNNCVLTFEIYDDGSSNPQINQFYFNLYSDVNPAGYKRVFTQGEGSLGNGGSGPTERTSNGPNTYDESLDYSDFSNSETSNAFTFSNWNYNATTGLLTFDYQGTLDPYYNSTGNLMTFSGSVKATTRQESLRKSAQ